MNLNKDGLEAARNKVRSVCNRFAASAQIYPDIEEWFESCAHSIIAAYLRTLPDAGNMVPVPDGLVERLEADAAQLIRMSKATEFGKDLSVRVKAPDLLIASLTEAATVIQTLQREAERLKALVSSSEAERYKSCGELLARAEAAEQQVRDMREGLDQIIRVDRCEKRTCVDFDPAGSTYEVEDVDGPAAAIARLLLKEGGE